MHLPSNKYYVFSHDKQSEDKLLEHVKQLGSH
jgi:hypothetical protein